MRIRQTGPDSTHLGFLYRQFLRALYREVQLPVSFRHRLPRPVVRPSHRDAGLGVLRDLGQRLFAGHLPPRLLGEVVDLEFLFVLLEDSTLLHRSQQGLSSLAGHVVQLGVQPSGKLVLEENIEE